MKPVETYTITVTPEGDGVPGVVRLRGLLKECLRRYGLKCLAVKQEGNGSETRGANEDER